MTLHEWERVSADAGGVLSRCKVPGGWIYREVRHAQAGVSLCFVPEAEPRREIVDLTNAVPGRTRGRLDVGLMRGYYAIRVNGIVRVAGPCDGPVAATEDAFGEGVHRGCPEQFEYCFLGGRKSEIQSQKRFLAKIDEPANWKPLGKESR